MPMVPEIIRAILGAIRAGGGVVPPSGYTRSYCDVWERLRITAQELFERLLQALARFVRDHWALLIAAAGLIAADAALHIGGFIDLSHMAYVIKMLKAMHQIKKVVVRYSQLRGVEK